MTYQAPEPSPESKAMSDLETALGDFDFGTIEEDAPQNVQDLPLETLLDRLNGVTAELRTLGEQLHPTSDRGRELHSERAALTIEKHRRVNNNDLNT